MQGLSGVMTDSCKASLSYTGPFSPSRLSTHAQHSQNIHLFKDLSQQARAAWLIAALPTWDEHVPRCATKAQRSSAIGALPNPPNYARL